MKLSTYAKTIGLATLIGLPFTCQQNKESDKIETIIEESAKDSSARLLAMLERGDRHSVLLQTPPDDRHVVKAEDIAKYIPNDSIGELFYEVYVGKADKAIRKKANKKGDLVTVGQGITGKEKITLANNEEARKGDYIDAHSVDSIQDLRIAEKDSIMKAHVSDSTIDSLKDNEKSAIITYLYNVNPQILIKAPEGKSFFEYLDEGNKGMVQSKFNVEPSSKSAAAGLAKRNLIQLLIFGDGKIYDEKKAIENFKKQVKIIRKNKKGEELLKEAIDIVREFGVNEENLKETEKKIFPEDKD